MCMLCVEYHKGKLTLSEAWKNYLEMVETMDADHSLEVQDMLWDAAIDVDEFGNFLILKENPYQKNYHNYNLHIHHIWLMVIYILPIV